MNARCQLISSTPVPSASTITPRPAPPRVDAILSQAGSRPFISRLSAVEMLSVFAGKVRSGTITLADFETLRKRFFTDLTNHVVHVIRMTGYHFQDAQRLIRKQGPTQKLRTLDALQLAVALD